jgi:hypothetical protein
MPKFDITKLNVAINKLLETTENPRHRFMLQAYRRHRYLEVAGRYEEIFAPDMMSMDPVYHFHQAGVETVRQSHRTETISRCHRMCGKVLAITALLCARSTALTAWPAAAVEARHVGTASASQQQDKMKVCDARS